MIPQVSQEVQGPAVGFIPPRAGGVHQALACPTGAAAAGGRYGQIMSTGAVSRPGKTSVITFISIYIFQPIFAQLGGMKYQTAPK